MSRLTRKENVDYTTNAIIHTVGFVVAGDRNKDYNNALKKLYELENLEEQYYRVLENDWRDDDYKPKYNMIFADFKKLVGKEIELITL